MYLLHISYFIEGHGFYVERAKDCLFIYHRGVISHGDLGGENHTHVAQVDVDGLGDY